MPNQPTPERNKNVAEVDEYAEVFDLEDQDDVLGSGIFDPSNRPPTANAETGVFGSHYSLPGYDARSIPFTVSQDVADITDDASVVFVPGGGMAYVESRGKLVGPAALGPAPRPPGLQPARPTGRYQSYVNMTPGRTPAPGWTPDGLLSQAEAAMPKQGARLDAPPAIPMTSASMPVPKVVPAAQRAPELGVPSPVVQVGAMGASFEPRSLSRAMPQPVSTLEQTSVTSAVRQIVEDAHSGPAYPYPQAFYPFPPAHPPRTSWYETQGIQGQPAEHRLAMSPSPTSLRQKMTMDPAQTEPRLAIGALDLASYGWTPYVVVGVALGAAAAWYFGD